MNEEATRQDPIWHVLAVIAAAVAGHNLIGGMGGFACAILAGGIATLHYKRSSK